MPRDRVEPVAVIHDHDPAVPPEPAGEAHQTRGHCEHTLSRVGPESMPLRNVVVLNSGSTTLPKRSMTFAVTGGASLPFRSRKPSPTPPLEARDPRSGSSLRGPARPARLEQKPPLGGPVFSNPDEDRALARSPGGAGRARRAADRPRDALRGRALLGLDRCQAIAFLRMPRDQHGIVAHEHAKRARAGALGQRVGGEERPDGAELPAAIERDGSRRQRVGSKTVPASPPASRGRAHRPALAPVRRPFVRRRVPGSRRSSAGRPLRAVRAARVRRPRGSSPARGCPGSGPGGRRAPPVGPEQTPPAPPTPRRRCTRPFGGISREGSRFAAPTRQRRHGAEQPEPRPDATSTIDSLQLKKESSARPTSISRPSRSCGSSSS